MTFWGVLSKRVSCIAATAAVTLFLVLPGHLSADPNYVQVQTFKTHSRLAFLMDDGVEAQWKDGKDGFELLFKGIGYGDLGAPLGMEEQWVHQIEQQLNKIGDSRLKSLQFKEVAGGLKIAGKWKFATGDQGPADPRMEHFDYRMKSPARYVLDFWAKPGPTVAEARAARKRSEHLIAVKKTEDAARQRRDRRLADIRAKAEADDTTGFCRQPLSDDQDVFLPFAPLHDKLDFSRWFPTTTADSEYMYLEPKGAEKDAQYVRLALNLYRQGNPALTLRTLDFFDHEHPTSLNRTEMRFLRANAMIRLGMKEEAIRVLKELISTQPASGVALHAGMYVAAKSYEAGNYLSAMEDFLWLANHYPGHRLLWVFHMGAAESLFEMKQTDRAAKEYQWVVLNAPEKKARALAAGRIGDLYLSRLGYERALGAYYQALNHFAAEAKDFPAIHLNRAESLYWLGQYDRAAEAFNGFLSAYAAHNQGWRATFRLGEIYARKAGDAHQAEGRRWFYETINHFPYSPGAKLARLRLLPCGDHGGFDAVAAETFLSHEAKALDADGEVIGDKYADLRAVARVRSLIMFEQPEAAVSAALQEIAVVKRPEVHQWMEAIVGRLFRKTVLGLLTQGKKYEALAFYAEKSKTLTGEHASLGPVDPDYLLKLSRAAADLGLGKKAEELADAYRSQDTKYGSGRALASADGKRTADEDLDAKLMASERAYTAAKALWMSSGRAAEGKIREQLNGVIAESEFSYDKEVLLGLLDEQAGKPASALGHAVRAEMLMPSAIAKAPAGDAARLRFWLASLQAKAGNPRVAVELLRKLDQTYKFATGEKAVERALTLGLAPLPALELIVMTQGDLLSQQGRWTEATATYARAIREGLGGNQALYAYARALSKTGVDGDHGKSRETYRKLAESKTDDFWRKLAREALATETDSSKQVNRRVAKEGKR